MSAATETALAPATEAELAETDRWRSHHGGGAPLRMQARRHPRLGPSAGRGAETSRLSGVVTYEPGELTLIARAGTPSGRHRGRCWPPRGRRWPSSRRTCAGLLGRNGVPTIGGVVAANASGPRRLLAGACRDALIWACGSSTGSGQVVKNGGRVMKNVTGL